MDWVLLLVALGVLGVFVAGLLVLVRRHRSAVAKPQHTSAEKTIELETQVRDGTTIAELPPPPPAAPAPPRRSLRRRFFTAGLVSFTLFALALGGFLLYARLTENAPARYLVLVAAFDDGGDGSTGRIIAQDLVGQITQQSRGAIRAETIAQRPADAEQALRLARSRGADLLIWGEVEPGGMLDDTSLRPRLIYTPNGLYAPDGWDGYRGRFVMPRSFQISAEPINGQAVLVPLIVALYDYSLGNTDAAYQRISRLVENYPAIDGPLPSAIRGNVLWARGFYGPAADAYRQALAQPGDDQARLANNLFAILVDAGSPDSLTAFAEAVRLLNGHDMGELRMNIGALALREQRADDAVIALEQARNLQAANAPLLLAIAAAYRDSGRLSLAEAALDDAQAQITADLAGIPERYRPMARLTLGANLAEQRALLDLARTLGAQGQISWEIEVAAQPDPNQLGAARDALRRASETTAQAVAGWRQRATSDNAALSGTGQTATGQAERAEQSALRQRYYQAQVETELARLRGPQATSVLGRLIAGLFSAGPAVNDNLAQLRDLDELRPNSLTTLAALGRALRIDGQLDAADQTYDRVVSSAPQLPEGYFGKAMTALDRGDRDAAIQLLNTAIERNGAFFPARVVLARIAESIGDWPTAITQRRALADLRPGAVSAVALAQDLRKSGPTGFAEASQVLLPLSSTNADAAIELARLYNDSNQPTEAIGAYLGALELAPSSTVAAFELGETYVRQGDLERAEQYLRDALRYDQNNVDARLALAALYHGPLNDPAAARDEYNAALSQGVRSFTQLVAIGDAAMDRGDANQAISAYERALSQRPDDVPLLHKLARAYLATNRLEAAAQHEERTITLTNTTGEQPLIAIRAEAFVTLGDIARRRGDPGAATNYYNQALGLNPQLISGIIGLGQAAVGQGNWGVALGYFEQAAAQPGGGDNASAQFWLGEGLLRNGNLPRAIEVYRRAIALKADFPEAYLGLAQAQHAQPTPESRAAALLSVEQALSLRPAYAEALLFHGKLLQELGRLEEASSAYDASIRANDRIPETYFRRGVLAIGMENYDSAISDLGQATRLQPNFPEAFYWLGRAYYAEGRLESAASALRQAIALNGGYIDAIFYSGLVAEDLGQRADAISAYQTVIQLDPAGDWGARAHVQLDRML